MAGSTRSLELAKGLINSGHEVIILTAKRDKNLVYPCEYNGIKLIWLDVAYSNYLGIFKRLVAFLKFSFLATVKVFSINYDIIYVSSTPLTVLFPALISKFFRKKNFIFEVRDLWPELPIAMGYLNSYLLKFIAFKFVNLGYKFAEKIITLSNDMAIEIVKRYNVNEKKIFVLPNFSSSIYFDYSIDDLNNTRSLFLKDDYTRLVIYPGTFGHVNGLQYIISLADNLQSSNYLFLCIGSGKESIYLKSLLEKLKLDNLLILDSVPKADIFKYIAASDFLISTVINIPELDWNSANKYFDGLAASKPVIINYGGWQSKELLFSNAGIVLDRNIEKAANQLLDIDQIKYETLRANAQKLSQKYDTKNIQARLIKILNNDKTVSNMY